MVGVNQQYEDGSSGSGGSRSSVDEISRVNASKEVEMEPAICRYKEITRPRSDVSQMKEEQQKFLWSLIVEKFGLDTLKSMIRDFDQTASTSGSQALQLQFLNGISTPVSTGMDIKGEDDKPFIVALIDGKGNTVRTGPEATAKVEIVVLEGDCNDDEAENWSSDEFNNKIVPDWNGKKILQGNTFLNLKEGVGSLDKLSFTQNKTWKKKRECRLGARSVNAIFAKEAKTKSFFVGDKRNLLYKKHPTPTLSDELWRLYMISRRSDCFTRMSEANIKTVMDFRTFHAINPERLKDILNVSPKKWKVITDHAHKCKDDKGVYLYHHPRDGERSNGVVFNIFGQLVGLIAESKFISRDKLPDDKKADAQELVFSSSEHWKEVVSFNDEASLINHLQLGTTTLNSPSISLNVTTPQTIDTLYPTNLTSPQIIIPISPKNRSGYDNLSLEGQSQSPKRSASEPAISNSPKKPREDHPLMSPSTPSVGTSRMTYMNATGTLEEPNNLEHDPELFEEEDDIMQYLNLFDRWKMVWYVVGWVSMISKVRKRRMSFYHQLLQTSDDDDKMFVIGASIKHNDCLVNAE